MAESYVVGMIEIMKDYPGAIPKGRLDELLKAKRRLAGLPIPPNFDRAVQATLNEHTSQSSVFRKKNKLPSDDLFYSPRGRGTGEWKVHLDRAQNWLRSRFPTADDF